MPPSLFNADSAVLEKKLKMWKDGQTNNRQQMIRKAHKLLRSGELKQVSHNIVILLKQCELYFQEIHNAVKPCHNSNSAGAQ